VRGIDEFVQYDLTISVIGVTLWLWVSLLWRDRALILVNSVGLLLLLRNLLQTLTG
jgi:ABC-type siderophore export system fused ATPase/permease subunit